MDIVDGSREPSEEDLTEERIDEINHAHFNSIFTNALADVQPMIHSLVEDVGPIINTDEVLATPVWFDTEYASLSEILNNRGPNTEIKIDKTGALNVVPSFLVVEMIQEFDAYDIETLADNAAMFAANLQLRAYLKALISKGGFSAIGVADVFRDKHAITTGLSNARYSGLLDISPEEIALLGDWLDYKVGRDSLNNDLIISLNIDRMAYGLVYYRMLEEREDTRIDLANSYRETLQDRISSIYGTMIKGGLVPPAVYNLLPYLRGNSEESKLAKIIFNSSLETESIMPLIALIAPMNEDEINFRKLELVGLDPANS